LLVVAYLQGHDTGQWIKLRYRCTMNDDKGYTEVKITVNSGLVRSCCVGPGFWVAGATDRQWQSSPSQIDHTHTRALIDLLTKPCGR
jgi:hypothetical protein